MITIGVVCTLCIVVVALRNSSHTCVSLTGADCPFPPLPLVEVVVAVAVSEGISQPTREGVASTSGSREMEIMRECTCACVLGEKV